MLTVFWQVNDKTLSGFIVDDLGDETFEDGSDDDEDDQFESVCAICDNGGEIIWYVSLFFTISYVCISLN